MFEVNNCVVVVVVVVVVSFFCFLWGGAGIFYIENCSRHKKCEKRLPKVKNEKCCPNHVGYIKISPKSGRMHQDVI